MKKSSLWGLLRKVHNDQEGTVSLETILIIGAIALPILIFLITVAWPTIKNYFNTGLTDLQTGADNAKQTVAAAGPNADAGHDPVVGPGAGGRRDRPLPAQDLQLDHLRRHLAALGLSAAGSLCWPPVG